MTTFGVCWTTRTMSPATGASGNITSRRPRERSRAGRRTTTSSRCRAPGTRACAGWCRRPSRRGPGLASGGRRAAPRDDLLSDLLQAQVANDAPMTDDEIVILISGLIGAGSETTALGGFISILTLLQNPDAWARLRGERALLPKAMNEIVRHGF